MSRWLTKGDENLITVMPECFYRASSVFCDTGENKKTLDSRLKTAGMTILIKEVFSGERRIIRRRLLRSIQTINTLQVLLFTAKQKKGETFMFRFHSRP